MKKALAKKRETYSPDDIRKAAQVYAVVGNFTKVSKQIGVPVTTLLYWRDNKDEWVTTYDKVRIEKRDELDAHFGEVLDMSMQGLADRLTFGDEFYDARAGKYYRKKVGARDLAIIAGVTFDKRQLLNNQPTSVKSNVSVEERLKAVAEMLVKHDTRSPEERSRSHFPIPNRNKPTD